MDFQVLLQTKQQKGHTMTVGIIMEKQNLEITMCSTGLRLSLACHGIGTGSTRKPHLHYQEGAAEFPEKAEVLTYPIFPSHEGSSWIQQQLQ